MEQSRVQSTFFIGLFAVVLLLNFFIFRAYFAVLFIAMTLAVIFYPVYTYLLKYLKSERLSALVTIILVFLIVLLPIIFFGQKLFFESRDLYLLLSSGNSNFVNTLVLKAKGFDPSIIESLKDYARNAA